VWREVTREGARKAKTAERIKRRKRMQGRESGKGVEYGGEV